MNRYLECLQHILPASGRPGRARRSAFRSPLRIGIALALLGVVPMASAGIDDEVQKVLNQAKAAKQQASDAKLQAAAAKGFAKTAADGVSLLTVDGGILSMVDRVNGLDQETLTELLEELPAQLSQFRALLGVLRATGDPVVPTDVGRLVAVLGDVLPALSGDESAALQSPFGVLERLIASGPPELVEGAGVALAQVGIDDDFVSNLETLIPQLALMKQANASDLVEQTAPAGDSTTLSPYSSAFDKELQGETSCGFINGNRQGLKAAAGAALVIAIPTSITAKIVSGTAKTVQTDVEVKIWGWAGPGIKTDARGAIGQIIAGIMDGVLRTATSVYGKLRHCELLWHAEKQHAEQLLIMRELCTVTRNRSTACRDLSQP